jgi:hypothetical protein
VALMPVSGTIDISIGVLTLFRLLPAVPLRMVFWGFKKARLRPLSLEPIWKLLERAGNFAMPVALRGRLTGHGGCSGGSRPCVTARSANCVHSRYGGSFVSPPLRR